MREYLSSDRVYTIGVDFKTVTEAYASCQANLDLCGHKLGFALKGDVVGAINCTGPMPGQRADGDVAIVGDHQLTTMLSDPSATCLVTAGGGARIAVRHMTLKAPGGFGLVAAGGVINGGDLWFDTMGNAAIDVCGPRSEFTAIGPLTWLFREFVAGVTVEDHGQANLGCELIISGAPNFAGAFAQADLGGMIDATNARVTPALATGRRFAAYSLGIVFTGTNGGNPDFFPGSRPGALDGGYYQ